MEQERITEDFALQLVGSLTAKRMALLEEWYRLTEDAFDYGYNDDGGQEHNGLAMWVDEEDLIAIRKQLSR